MATPVVAVLNMKGGVGKTTISAHVSREIFESKQAKTLLVDLDPQYNLTQQLTARDTYNDAVAKNKTVLRLFEPAPAADFFDINTNNDPPPKATDIRIRLRYFTAKRGGPGCLNRFSASISGASASVKLPSGVAAG